MPATRCSKVAKVVGHVAEAARTSASGVRVCVVANPLAAALAHLLRALRMTIEQHSTARLAVAGGSVLPVLEAAHAQAPELWPSLLLTWVDERVVLQRDAASNCGAAQRSGALAEPSARLLLPLLHDAEVDQPALALQRTQAALHAQFRGGLYLTLLGLGEDGHIASLFPGKPWNAADADVLAVTDAPKPPSTRITLTQRMLHTATTHIVFAVGAAKRNAIARVLAADPTLPLTGLAGVYLYTDQ